MIGWDSDMIGAELDNSHVKDSAGTIISLGSRENTRKQLYDPSVWDKKFGNSYSPRGSEFSRGNNYRAKIRVKTKAGTVIGQFSSRISIYIKPWAQLNPFMHEKLERESTRESANYREKTTDSCLSLGEPLCARIMCLWPSNCYWRPSNCYLRSRIKSLCGKMCQNPFPQMQKN